MLVSFGAKTYKGHPLNHRIAQAKNGLIYFANYQGLMEYDGHQWQLMRDCGLVFDLDIDEKGRIWTSGFRRFGWFELNARNEWEYHGLYHETERFGSVESEFRNVIVLGETTYFAAHNSLYAYEEGTGLRKLIEGHFIRRLHRLHGKIYVVGADSKFHTIDNDELIPVEDSDFFWGDDTVQISGLLGEDRLGLFTVANGLWSFDGVTFTHLPQFARLLPQGAVVTDIAEANNGQIILTTAAHGLWICAPDGSIATLISTRSGLPTNALQSLMLDKDGSFWIAHDKGVSLIAIPLEGVFYSEQQGLRGIVATAAYHGDWIYAGTNQGAFRANVQGLASRNYALRWESLGYVSSTRTIATHGNDILLGAFSGLYLLEQGNILQALDEGRDCSMVLSSRVFPGRVYVGGYQGLNFTEHKGGSWAELQELLPEYGIVHGYGEDSFGNLWIRMGDNRVGLLQWDHEQENWHPFKVLGAGQGVPQGWINPLIVDNRVFVFGSEMLEFDFAEMRFHPNPKVNYFPGEGPFYYAQELTLEDGSRWVDSNVAMANLTRYPSRRAGPMIEFFGETMDNRASAFATTPVGDVFAMINGMLIVFPETQAGPAHRPPHTTLRKVINMDTGEVIASNITTSNEPPLMELPSTVRNLAFEFVLDRYWQTGDHSFQFFLEGHDTEWLHYRPQTRKEFTNLNPGTYQFYVHGRDALLTGSETVHFHFRIQTPWRQSAWAYLSYGILIVAMVYLGVIYREAQLRRSNHVLQREVQTRTGEVLLKAKELSLKNRELKNALEVSERLKGEAQAASIAKGRFLASMSHEIRTPMNGVIGMCSMLEQTELDTQQVSFVHTIKSSGESLLNILNGILDFSKIEAGKLELDHSPFDLRTCAEDVLDLLAYGAHIKGLDLSLEMCPNVISPRIGDPTRLRQVLINLIGNAIKFTDKGEIHLIITREDEERDPESILFSVADSGIGIQPDKIPSLFEPFSQLDDSNLRRFGGTGLGLSISRNLVWLMGGDISVTSSPGRGSSFSFKLALPVDPAGVPFQPDPALKDKAVWCIASVSASGKALTCLMRHFRVNCGFSPEWGDIDLLESSVKGDLFAIVLDEHDIRIGLDDLICFIRGFPFSQNTPIFVLTNALHRQSSWDHIHFVRKPVRLHLMAESLDKFALTQPLPKRLPKVVGPLSHAPSPPSAPLLKDSLEPLPCSILLAEDNPVNQKVAILLLKRLGLQVDIAGNGVEAVSMCTETPYHIVLMDVQMPEMDGLEATRTILSRIDAATRPKIIAMTAGVTHLDRSVCTDAGMDGFVEKPVRIDLLRGEILRIQGILRKEGRLP